MMNEYLGLANALNDMFYGDGYRGFPVDVVQGENSYQVICEMPGVSKEDIQVSFNEGVLTIEATKKHDKNHKYLIHERNFMKLKRELEFGEINEESMAAKYADGILTITINTVAPKPKKTIEIQ